MGVFYGSSSASTGQRPGDESAIKRQRTGTPAVHFKALQFSWTSLALAGIDNHGKVTFTFECSVQITPQRAVEVEPLLHLFASSSALHAAGVAIYGPGAGDEYYITPPAVFAGVLHGDGLRLVGRSPARAAHYGAQSSGEAARGIHEAEPGVATGQQGMTQNDRWDNAVVIITH